MKQTLAVDGGHYVCENLDTIRAIVREIEGFRLSRKQMRQAFTTLDKAGVIELERDASGKVMHCKDCGKRRWRIQSWFRGTALENLH